MYISTGFGCDSSHEIEMIVEWKGSLKKSLYSVISNVTSAGLTGLYYWGTGSSAQCWDSGKAASICCESFASLHLSRALFTFMIILLNNIYTSLWSSTVHIFLSILVTFYSSYSSVCLWYLLSSQRSTRVQFIVIIVGYFNTQFRQSRGLHIHYGSRCLYTVMEIV